MSGVHDYLLYVGVGLLRSQKEKLERTGPDQGQSLAYIKLALAKQN